MPNFVSIALLCCPLVAKKPKILPFFGTSAFSGVANWQQSENVEHGCTTTNLPLFNVKIVSVLQRLLDENGRTISDVQQRDDQTNQPTNGQKKPQGKI